MSKMQASESVENKMQNVADISRKQTNLQPNRFKSYKNLLTSFNWLFKIVIER